MSIFVVDLHLPGVSRGPKGTQDGQRASQVGALTFEAVGEPPSDALLGEEGRGFHMMMSVLEKGRFGPSPRWHVGIAQRVSTPCRITTQARRQFGRRSPISRVFQWMLADIGDGIEAARTLVHRAAVLIDLGQPATAASSMAKCFASDMAVARTADAVQIFGGSGYIRGFEVERLYRDAKITQIYEGTNQIQRTIIARDLLKAGRRDER